MLIGERRSLRCDDIFNTRHKTRDQVKLAFTNNGALRIQQRAFGFIEAEKDFALGKDGCLGRVHILRGLFVAAQNPSTETDHPALLIANGEHQTPAKTIVVSIRALLLDDQSRFLDQFEIVSLACCPIHRVIPGVRRCSEPKQFYCVSTDTAFGQIFAGNLPCGFAGQRILPALGDLLVDFKEFAFDVARELFSRILFVIERNFRAISQTFDRVWKSDVLVLLDERKDIAALVAAETMKNLTVRIDIEARGFFLVKWTKGNKVRAGSLERNIGTDNIHDVTRGTNLLKGGGGK
jgi:hypothetical protein